MRRALHIAAAVLLAGLLAPLAPAAPAHADEECDQESRDDPMPNTPWPLERLQPERVWPLTQGEDVTVAVIDSGVGEHPLLDDQVTEAYDYTDDGLGARCDLASHGTLVAGIIAGSHTSESPFHGVAPQTSIASYRVIDTSDGSTGRDAIVPVVEAIHDAVDAGVEVINLSLTALNAPALREAVDYAEDNDVVVVAAAGNTGADGGASYPAAYDNTVAVAGVTPDGSHVESSSIGDYVDIAAPGEEIDGPAPEGGGFGRREDGGTSFAAAYVSATAALLKSLDPDATPAEIAYRLTATADAPPGGRNPQVGHGELNVYRAVTTALPEIDDERLQTQAGPQDPPVIATDTGKAVRQRAFVFTSIAAGTVVLLLCAKVVVPRGRSRGWRCP